MHTLCECDCDCVFGQSPDFEFTFEFENKNSDSEMINDALQDFTKNKSPKWDFYSFYFFDKIFKEVIFSSFRSKSFPDSEF